MAKAASPARVYVSITGLTLKRPWHIFRFFRHAAPALWQARKAPGNLHTDVKTINGVRHTITVWEDEKAMRRFLYRGAHAKAIRAFPEIADGKTFGFLTTEIPDWDTVHSLWHEHGQSYDTPARLEAPAR